LDKIPCDFCVDCKYCYICDESFSKKDLYTCTNCNDDFCKRCNENKNEINYIVSEYIECSEFILCDKCKKIETKIELEYYECMHCYDSIAYHGTKCTVEWCDNKWCSECMKYNNPIREGICHECISECKPETEKKQVHYYLNKEKKINKKLETLLHFTNKLYIGELLDKYCSQDSLKIIIYLIIYLIIFSICFFLNIL
jgi:hypothetical protein